MPRAGPPLALALLALAAGASAGGEEPAGAQGPAPAGNRPMSAQLSTVFAERRPAFAPAAAPPPVASRVLYDPPANGIVRLPNYVVREPKVPPPPPWQQVDQGRLVRWAMEHYLGPENGFDRGFLNLITSKQFPLLGLFGSVSNEQRALNAYHEEQRRELMKELMELNTLGQKRGGDPAHAKVREEIQRSFQKDPRYGD